MPTIVDLPNEPKFTIKAVASQTGIRPVTLRAWERRHEVLNPHRADNHYRLYSEQDVAILRWLKNRVDEGISISNAVSELRRMTNNNIWPEAIPAAPSPSAGKSDTPPVHYAKQLYLALVKHEENRAGDILREVHALFDLLTIIEQVYIPALREIGEAWYRGEIRVTTEHFASAYLRGKMLSLLQAYPSRRSSPLVLIGCAPMEQHELGSLMLAVLLRAEGIRVEFLGPDIPVEDLADYASYEMPAMVILSATSEYSAREMKHMQDLLKKTRPTPIFGYGGRAFDLQPELRKEISGTYLGNSLEIARDTVKSLLKTYQKGRARN
ncbi:MAG: cobalamin B12-binding domain-containing protein [Anaerolineaceae bacterium]|nr:cobalamin B12-binding domain-containing protein [Anaerolineaceae bacterium]